MSKHKVLKKRQEWSPKCFFCCSTKDLEKFETMHRDILVCPKCVNEIPSYDREDSDDYVEMDVKRGKR